MQQLEDILTKAVKHGASDVHLGIGSPPAVRIEGVIRFLNKEDLTGEEMDAFLDELMEPEEKQDFLSRGDHDLAYGIPGVGRFRVNLHKQRGTVGIVMRYVKASIPDFDSLNLPVEAMERIAKLPRGLVLIVGTTGSGKSTTLASIIDRVNRENRYHIVTLEDPIEYLHKNRHSIITQREVSIDTQDFHTALRAVMREDPDVILIGEMRDADTFQACMAAAETGHLVFSTLHTTNAMMTIDRILDLFPANQQDQIRSQLSLQLRGVVAMRLVPTTDGKGRVPACEVMFNTPGVASLIREGNIGRIGTAISSGVEEGMQTFNMSLMDFVKQGMITKEAAAFASDNPDELSITLQGVKLNTSRGGILKK